MAAGQDRCGNAEVVEKPGYRDVVARLVRCDDEIAQRPGGVGHKGTAAAAGPGHRGLGETKCLSPVSEAVPSSAVHEHQGGADRHLFLLGSPLRPRLTDRVRCEQPCQPSEKVVGAGLVQWWL